MTVEDWAEIRRLHRVEGMAIKAIARRLGVSRNAVRRALARDVPPKYVRPPKGSIVDAVEPAIRELLQANPDENRAQARIAIAKAAGILSEDVVLAEGMLEKHRATKAKTRGKTATGRKRAARTSGQEQGEPGRLGTPASGTSDGRAGA